MTINEGLFTSKSDNWATPQEFFDKLNAEFHFTLDPCAHEKNAKCDQYFTLEDDGLTKDWTGVVFMNPPYGRVIGKWVQKAYQESQQGATVVCLVPARTDTGWWHDWAMKAHEIRYLRGRLKFGDNTNSAPFPSAVLVFRGDR